MSALGDLLCNGVTQILTPQYPSLFYNMQFVSTKLLNISTKLLFIST